MPPITPLHINKPWGWELLFTEGAPYAGKILFVREGEALSRQYHEIKHETLIVLDGHAILEIGTPGSSAFLVRELGPNDAWHIAAGTIHRFIARTDTRLLEVSTPELDDLVRLDDRYGR